MIAEGGVDHRLPQREALVLVRQLFGFGASPEPDQRKGWKSPLGMPGCAFGLEQR